jgi:HAMP domain-containing protein
MLELKNTINTMVDQLSTFASEVTRVAREVGTEGKLGGQAKVEGVAGVWRDLTDNVNQLAGNLTVQLRDVSAVATAIADGDLTRKITVEAAGEILQIKDVVNAMVDRLSAFASEVTRVAREVGTEGVLGGQANVGGVAGTWKDLTDSVNFMASSLTGQVRDIALVTTAVANGDLSQKITVDVKGEMLELKNTINTMVDQLSTFASEVTRVAREVGTEGELGGQADVPGVAGTWKDLTDAVNFMAGNLTGQVRNIALVTTAVANGDLSQKITVDVKGEMLELKNTINTMVDQLSAFASEVTRVAREVGTEGVLGGQAEVPGVAGTWKDLTDNVNQLAGNLTVQLRDVSAVATAIADGDLTRKITVEVRGEILQIKQVINSMVDRLSVFADEVTRVAREVGTEGVLGGQAKVEGVAGVWRGLTENVNQLAGNLTVQLRDVSAVATAIADGDLTRKITVEAAGEILQIKEVINAMVDRLSVFADEVTRVAREVGTQVALGGQAQVPGVAGLEGTSPTRELDGLLAHEPGPRHRPGDDARCPGRPEPEDHGGRRGRDARAQESHQHDGRPALLLRRRGRPRGPRGGHRGPARRPGGRARRRRRVARPDRERQRHGLEPDRPGSATSPSGHRGGPGRPDAERSPSTPRARSRAQGRHQRDGRPALLVRRRGHPRGPRRSARRGSSAARPRSRACRAPGRG